MRFSLAQRRWSVTNSCFERLLVKNAYYSQNQACGASKVSPPQKKGSASALPLLLLRATMTFDARPRDGQSSIREAKLLLGVGSRDRVLSSSGGLCSSLLASAGIDLQNPTALRIRDAAKSDRVQIVGVPVLIEGDLDVLDCLFGRDRRELENDLMLAFVGLQ